MLRALPGIKEDGQSLTIDAGWEVSMQAGRIGTPIAAGQIERITLHEAFGVFETHKAQRVVVLLDEIRGFTAEPSTTDRKGRKTGFV